MADVQLPGLGKVNKKWVLAVGGISAVILGYAYYKHRNASGPITATPATDTGASADPTIDPTTGLPYSDNPAYYEAGGGYSAAGYYDPATGTTVTTGSGQIATITPTNASWAQQAESYLTGLGYDSQVSAAALGKVFNGQSITQAQADIWAAATAFEGQPPQGHPPLQLMASPPSNNGSAPTNIRNAKFEKITKATSWANVAKADNVFGGSGAALYQYNLLPGKHAGGDYTKVQATGGGSIKANPGFQVAIPVKGQRIQLPAVGTVTS